MGLSSLARLLGGGDERESLRPLYTAIVERARQPHWYLDGAVPDTREGRFEMVAAILSLVLIRLEAFGERRAKTASTQLTEIFIDDMDGQLRESGVGDIVVGKHVGRMMSALGGRLGAYRDALADGGLADPLRRNLYRGEPVADAALEHSAARLRATAARLKTLRLDDLLDGRLE